VSTTRRHDEKRGRGTPPFPHRALVLSGPLAVAGVIAVAWSGSHLGAAPSPGAQAASADAAAHVRHAGDLLTPQTLSVRVRFSAGLQEMVGERAVSVTLPEGGTVGTLLIRLSDRYPALAVMGPSIMVAVDGEIQWPDRVLASGEVVELVSQMAGG
jgi:molybdopterin converting factor small subunit